MIGAGSPPDGIPEPSETDSAMTDHHFSKRRSRALAVAFAAALLGSPVGAFEAQGPQAPLAPAAQKAAKPAVDETNPKVVARVQTELMNSGNLDDAAMARSLLKRGTAHNSLGRYAAALADLTGAIFIGLGDAEMREAYRERAKAYAATGQTRLAEQDNAKAGSSGSLAAATPRPAASGAGEPDTSKLKLPAFKTTVVAPTGDDPAPAASGNKAAGKAVANKAAPAPEPAAPAASAAAAGDKKKAIPAFRTSIVGN